MPQYFEFEVSLEGVKPKIWRRFQMRPAATFADLHMAIQEACGWGNYHLFEFREPKRRGTTIAGIPDDEWEFREVPDAARAKLASYFKKKGDRCHYVYDFGDDWTHRVQLKKIIEVPEMFRRRLVGGARAFPLEDCGGVWGYYECLMALGHLEADAADVPPEEELRERREWLDGTDWDPETFDLEAAKKQFDR